MLTAIHWNQIVEQSSVNDLFSSPKHPYTQALLASLPNPEDPQGELSTVPGLVPSIFELPRGCRFKDRCPHRFEACDRAPKLLQVEENHFARCHLYD